MGYVHQSEAVSFRVATKEGRQFRLRESCERRLEMMTRSSSESARVSWTFT
jgi:hypothetical protein